MSKKKELPILQSAKRAKPKFDCLACPGKCCTYDLIEVTRADVQKLAKHHGLDFGAALQRFTKEAKQDGKTITILRHRKDDVYDTACRFLHPVRRICTIYDARPQVCHDYPHGQTCGYFNYLMWERKHQDDPEFVA